MQCLSVRYQSGVDSGLSAWGFVPCEVASFELRGRSIKLDLGNTCHFLAGKSSFNHKGGPLDP